MTDDIVLSHALPSKSHELDYQITHVCYLYGLNVRRVRYRRHLIITHSLPTKFHELRISRTLSSNNTHDDISLSHTLPSKSHELDYQITHVCYLYCLNVRRMRY